MCFELSLKSNHLLTRKEEERRGEKRIKRGFILDESLNSCYSSLNNGLVFARMSFS